MRDHAREVNCRFRNFASGKAMAEEKWKLRFGKQMQAFRKKPYTKTRQTIGSAYGRKLTSALLDAMTERAKRVHVSAIIDSSGHITDQYRD